MTANFRMVCARSWVKVQEISDLQWLLSCDFRQGWIWQDEKSVQLARLQVRDGVDAITSLVFRVIHRLVRGQQ